MGAEGEGDEVADRVKEGLTREARNGSPLVYYKHLKANFTLFCSPRWANDLSEKIINRIQE